MKKILLLLIFLLSVFTTVSFAATEALNGAEYWKNSRKINVYIPQNRRKTIVKSSFKAWVKATDEHLGFVFLDFPKNANIEIEFVDILPNGQLQSGEILGLTKSAYSADGRVLSAKIQIPYKSQDGVVLDGDTLERVLIHEIGHALGLPHTSDRKSIMYPTTSPLQTITPAEVTKLKSIYKW